MNPNTRIEEILGLYAPAIGRDYARYRNHVYRVFLNCLLMDPEEGHSDAYAIAAAFHDMGIWTKNTIDYLDPSIAEAKLYLDKRGESDLFEEVGAMILWHHKVSVYKGPFQQKVETFRRADWIDVSLRLITFGTDRRQLRANSRALPNAGFHWFLVKKISANLLRHPLRPLPMFRI